MVFLPRPDAERTAQDVDEIYALAAESLQLAPDPPARRRAFRTAMLRAYEAGVDAQRELAQRSPRAPRAPTQPLGDDEVTNPGTLPPAPLLPYPRGPKKR